jgi:glyoxylase-like metal-dependent hydrolase (beta-lactamase superfamily II)
VTALALMVAGAESVTVVVTHEHDDHADAAFPLAKLTGGSVVGLTPGARHLVDGDRVSTDVGELVAVDTPGHCPDHLCFHWPERAGLFAGDLVIGSGDTTWVAGYPGAVRDYLASIERIRSLGLSKIYPAHGEPIEDVAQRLDRFESHRRKRIEQVSRVLEKNPAATRREIMAEVYGDTIPKGLERAAIASMDAILDYLGEAGRP